MAEDNSIKLKMLESMTARFAKISFIASENIDGATSFGEISVVSPSAVIVTYTGASRVLNFDGKPIASGPSPLVAVLDGGRGELALSGNVTDATALVIGNVNK